MRCRSWGLRGLGLLLNNGRGQGRGKGEKMIRNQDFGRDEGGGFGKREKRWDLNLVKARLSLSLSSNNRKKN